MEYQTGEKSLFETRLEQRIMQLGLNVQGKIDVVNTGTTVERPKIFKIIDKIFEIMEREYEHKKPADYSSVQDIRFYINSSGPMSPEILLQKMFSQEFEITNDDILRDQYSI